MCLFKNKRNFYIKFSIIENRVLKDYYFSILIVDIGQGPF